MMRFPAKVRCHLIPNSNQWFCQMREMDLACVVLPTEKESSGKIEGSETDKEGEGRKEARGQGVREEQLLMGCIDLEIAVSLSFAIALSLLCLATTLLRSSICSTRGGRRETLGRANVPYKKESALSNFCGAESKSRSRCSGGNPLFSPD